MSQELRWDLDYKGTQFLDVVQYYGGKASMREIREITGLNRSEANHRFSKLDDMHLIDVLYQDYKSQKMKVARLTPKCESEIQQGLLKGLERKNLQGEEIETLQNEVVSLRDEVESLENRVDTLTESATDNRDEIKDLGVWTTSRIRALADALRDGSDTPKDYLD